MPQSHWFSLLECVISPVTTPCFFHPHFHPLTQRILRNVGEDHAPSPQFAPRGNVILLFWPWVFGLCPVFLASAMFALVILLGPSLALLGFPECLPLIPSRWQCASFPPRACPHSPRTASGMAMRSFLEATTNAGLQNLDQSNIRNLTWGTCLWKEASSWDSVECSKPTEWYEPS